MHSGAARRADTVGDELNRIWTEHGKRLSPGAVVDAARPPGATLHPCFEWNDRAAGEAYRRHQARQLIRSVQIVADGSTEPLFVHVRVEAEDSPRLFYQHVEVLKKEPAQYLAALAEARRKLEEVTESFREVQRIGKQVKSRDAEKIAAIIEALSTAHAMAVRLQ